MTQQVSRGWEAAIFLETDTEVGGHPSGDMRESRLTDGLQPPSGGWTRREREAGSEEDIVGSD